MRVRTARLLTAVFFLAYAVVLTWPGALPFNRIRPLVLGLPFTLFWSALWVAMAGFVLWGLDRVEARERRRRAASGPRAPHAPTGPASQTGPQES